VPTRRPVFLYTLLTALFAITLLYQVRYLPDIVRSQRIDSPFFFVATGSNRIALATPETASYGIHTGDRLLAVNGVPFTGSGVLGRARAMRRPGVPMEVTIAPKNGADSDQRTISLPVIAESRNSWDALSTFVVQMLLPAVSLLLGFWVVFRRPRDPMAWLLLGVMMSFPHILQAFVVQGWAPGWREAAVLYETVLNSLFPIVMFLFGRFFPEPFPRGSTTDRIWRAIQWLCAVPFAMLALAGLVVEVASLSDYRSVAGIGAILARLDPVAQVFSLPWGSSLA
jgi:phosphoserine phosphatase RsbU/P